MLMFLPMQVREPMPNGMKYRSMLVSCSGEECDLSHRSGRNSPASSPKTLVL